MTKITQIDDKSAATAWSPVRSCADVIALGTKVSSFFRFSYGCRDEESSVFLICLPQLFYLLCFRTLGALDLKIQEVV